MKKYVAKNPILPNLINTSLPRGILPVRTKYKNVSRSEYPRYNTFEVNPPKDNLEVQYNKE